VEVAKRFADESFDAIARDCFADAFASDYGVAILWRVNVVWANPGNQRTIRVRFALRPHRPNL